MGKILVIRHAIAEDVDAGLLQGRDDSQRALTDAGRRKFTQTTKGLARLVKRIDLIATSPLLRAVQTGEILSRQYCVKPIQIAELEPSAPPGALLEWYREQASSECVALVGHEPSLSSWVSEMLTAHQRSIVQLKKGAACLLDVDLSVSPKAGRATLQWLLQPSQLRLLAPG